MDNKIRNILNDIMYTDLNLIKVEERIKKAGIPKKSKDDSYPQTSDYFTLINDIHFENLSEDEKKELDNYYNDYLNKHEGAKQKLAEFLKNNKYKLLIPEDKEGITFYGPPAPNYSAPNDAIVFGFHFIEFDDENPLSDEQYEFICDQLNYIESELSKQNNVKISVIEYNEMPLQERRLI